MTPSIDDLFTDSPKYAESPSYTDVSVLKSYQEGKVEANDDSCFEAKFVCDVVKLMTELRYEAERNFRNGATQAQNKREELCLTIDAIKERLTLDNNDEPAEQLVSVIANQHLRLIEELVHSMRKTLRRKRDLVSISAVQQFDNHCLRWLARQPGHFAQEKAGVRQKLMAVVREETRNTLENRVLKDFMLRVEILTRRYLLQNESKWPLSSRVKDVKHLRSVLNNALKLPEILSLPQILSAVQPNYVLLHDARYSKLWELYRLVLAQTRIAEIVWPKRHRLFSEVFCTWFIARLSLEYKSFFNLAYWIEVVPSQGCFMVNPIFSSAFEDSKGNVLSCIVPPSIGKIELRNPEFRKMVQLLYVPGDSEVDLFFPDDDITYVACCFSKKSRSKSEHKSNVLWINSFAEIDGAISRILEKN